MLNYKLLHRDADGVPVNNDNGEAGTDSSAIKEALASAIDLAMDRAESGSYELWMDGRRVAIIEVNGTDKSEPAPPPPRRRHLWSWMLGRSP